MAVGSLVDVVMPQMGVSVSEGTISRWAKQVGDHVEADETIVEISTDKVDTEVPSPASGTVVEILTQEGETVPVTTVIARIDTAGGAPLAPVEPVPAAEQPAEAAPPAEAAEAAAPAPAAAAPTEPAAPAEPAAGETAPAAPADEPPPHFGPATTTGGYDAPSDLSGDLSPAPPAPGADGEANGDMRTFMSPVVARMVAEHGLDIAQIPGTGRGGRVTKRDVEVFLEGRRRGAPPAPAAPHRPRRHPQPPHRPPLLRPPRRPHPPLRLRPHRHRARRRRAGAGTRPGARRRLRQRRRGDLQVLHHPPCDREAHDGVDPDDGAADDDHRDRHVGGGGAPAGAEGRLPDPARRQPDVPAVHHEGDHRRDRQVAVGERGDRGRRGDREALGQPRHGRRGRRLQGPPGAGDQERRVTVDGRAGARADRRRRSGPQEGADGGRDDGRARSRSRTPVATAP